MYKFDRSERLEIHYFSIT